MKQERGEGVVRSKEEGGREGKRMVRSWGRGGSGEKLGRGEGEASREEGGTYWRLVGSALVAIHDGGRPVCLHIFTNSFHRSQTSISKFCSVCFLRLKKFVVSPLFILTICSVRFFLTKCCSVRFLRLQIFYSVRILRLQMFYSVRILRLQMFCSVRFLRLQMFYSVRFLRLQMFCSVRFLRLQMFCSVCFLRLQMFCSVRFLGLQMLVVCFSHIL